MIINARGGTVDIKLTQHEGRQMRDASYLATRIAANLPDEERSAVLKAAAALILAAANEFTPDQNKLNRQDAVVVPETGDVVPDDLSQPVTEDVSKPQSFTPPPASNVSRSLI